MDNNMERDINGNLVLLESHKKLEIYYRRLFVNRKILFLLCILLFTTILVACNGQGSDSNYSATTKAGETTAQIEQTSSDGIDGSPKPMATEEELKAEDSRFKNLIKSLNADHLTKLRMDILDKDNKDQVFFSEDPAFIQKWVDLLKKMKTSVAQNNMMLGNYGFCLSFYEGENIVVIGSTILPYLYTTTERTMHVVENYSELEEEFNELLEQILPPEFLS